MGTKFFKGIYAQFQNEKWILLLLLTCFFQLASGQKNQTQSEKTFFEKFDSKKDKRVSADREKIFRKKFSLSEDIKLKIHKTEEDDLGFTHYKYHYQFKGIPVEHGVYMVHSKNGIIQSINGEHYSVTNININPSITGQQALVIAMQAVNAKAYNDNTTV